MPRNYSPDDIANWFLAAVDRDAGDSITHLKLQKLVYYAQAWALVLLEDDLFDENFQAWIHGPVLPSLYSRFAEYRWEALPSPPSEWDVEFDPDTTDLLLDVYNNYGGLHARKLEELTHSEPPWLNARNGLSPDQPSNAVISKTDMATYYSSLLEFSDAEEEYPS